MGDSMSSMGMNGDVCAPLDALQVDGTPPEVGDNVEMTVKGTVTSVNGGMAYVKPEMVNDVPVPEKSEADKEPDEDELRMNAQNYDRETGY